MIEEESNATISCLMSLRLQNQGASMVRYSGVRHGTIQSFVAYDCMGLWGICCAAACSLSMLEALGLTASKAVGN
jgi:hypothetical protein